MQFYMNILTTYFPDRDPPYKVYYEQILEQIELAEELGWECFMFNEHHFLGYGGLIANPAVDAGRGRGTHLAHPLGYMHRYHPAASSAAVGRGVRYDGCHLRREAGVRHRFR